MPARNNALTNPCGTSNPQALYYREQLAATTALLKAQADARTTAAGPGIIRDAAFQDSQRLGTELEMLALEHVTVVGGVPDKDGAYPSQVAFITGTAAAGSPSMYACGIAGSGTLIKADWILTAAHVVCGSATEGSVATAKDHTAFRVLAGSETLSAAGTPLTVAHIVCNPTYRTGAAQIDDIALVQLSAKLANATLASYVTDEATEAGIAAVTTDLFVTGWGATASGGNGSDDLLVGPVKIVGNAACNSAYVGNPITGSMICAGDTQSAHCSGDSGGPLWVKGSGGKLQQIAIVSFTPDTGCLVDKPGVYTRIAPYYVSFIKPTLGMP